MNYRYVWRQLGLLMLVLSLTLVAIALAALAPFLPRPTEDTPAALALVATACIGLLSGGAMWVGGRGSSDHFGRREALLLVALSWVFGAALAALPYWCWANLFDKAPADHAFRSFIDCYFESMSGLTTTGATILVDIDTLPESILLWRALTHWFGGLGIVVLFVAVLPSLGVGGKRLFAIESTGMKPQGVRPRIRETARALWLIYMGITAAAVLALRATGQMDWFDSLLHAFSMVSTGGLSTRDASIGHYDSVAVDVVCMVFMVFAGVNFAIFYMLWQGRWREAIKDVEVRIFLILKLVVILVVAVSLLGKPIVTMLGQTITADPGDTLRYSAFQTIALHTGTGFATADYDQWPLLARILLVGLMFIGGCAGSTAGGIKVIRFWVTLRVMVSELEKMYRPTVVRPLKVGRSTVDPESAMAAVVYFLSILVLFGLGAGAIAILESSRQELSLTSALTASISTLCNVGPGLGAVGATQTYAPFSDASKLVMCLLMALGRLEVFTLLVLFLPRFWRTQ